VDDGLLDNARCSSGGSEFVSGEAILAAFAAEPFDLSGELFAVETEGGAALIGENRAILADVYDGRIGRLWRIGSARTDHPERRIDVPFDADMRQERGDLYFRSEDHPDLDLNAVEQLLQAGRALVERERSAGNLRVRAFFVRAFGEARASAALLSVFTLSNHAVRAAAFSYAIIGASADQLLASYDQPPVREWSPRF
jgi:hypothetical protein